MNMISTGSFLTETGASNKQSELVKKLTAAWEKKNSKTARAGGASLMALSLAACGGEDNTPFSKADVDAAKAEGVASVDITSDNTDVMLAQADYDAAIEAAKTSNDADIAAAAKTEALTSADGTIYATVDAAYTAGSNVTNAAAVEAALTDASGVKHNNVDAAISSNDAAIETAATAAAEASLVAGSGFSSVADLLAAYTAAVAPDAAAALSLTTSSDRLVEQFTGVSDTVTGDFGTVGAADIIIDSYTTDSDVANLTMGSDVQTTIANIETINIDGRADSSAASAFVVDAVNMSGYNTLNIDSNYGETKFTVEDAAIGATIAVDSTATVVTVDLNRSGSTEGYADAMTVSFGGNVTATLDKGSTDDVDILTIHSTGAKKNTITLADQDYVDSGALDDDQIIVTGDQTLVLVSDNDTDAKILDGAIVTNNGTGALQIKLTGTTDLINAEIDLDSVDGEIVVALPFDTSTTSTNLKVKDNAIISTGAIDILAETGTITGVAGGTNTFNFAHETGNQDGTSAQGGTLQFVNQAVVNIANTATTAINADDANITVSYAGIGNSTDLNIDTGVGFQIGNIAAATSRTLDAVTITGGKDFNAGTVASNSLTANVEDINLGNITAAGAYDITASKTVTLAAVGNSTANTGTLTVNAAGNISVGSTIGNTTDFGLVDLTSTGGSITLSGQVDTDATVDLSAAAALKTVSTGAINAVGKVTVVAGSTITLGATSATGGVELTAGNTTTNSTFDTISGALTLNGAGVTYAAAAASDTITGAVTINDASLSFTGATNLLTGAVTHNGAGDVSIQDLAGTYSGAGATGAVDIDDTAAGATSIVTGSGNDNIITGDVAAQISTGDGNDVVNADAVGAAKQVIIDTGAGVDTITGGAGVSDQLTGGAGTDTFIISEVADGGTISGMDTITDFTTGAAGDVLTLATGAEFDTDGSTVLKVDTTDSSSTATDATDVLLLTGVGYANEAALITALTASSGITAATANDIKDSMIMAVWYNTTAGKVQVSQVNETTTTADDTVDGAVTFVTLDGLGLADIGNLVADNFGAIA